MAYNNGWEIKGIDDKFTRRHNARQESINLARQNALASAAAQRNAQRNSIKRAEIQAGAAQRSSNLTNSARAAEGATHSSRLLAEFENERKNRRSLDIRRQDQAIGQVRAGFGASGVGSIGAAQEIARQSTLGRNVSEGQLSSRRENILQQGRSSITSALASAQATAISAGASVAAAKQNPNIQTRATATINPFKKSQVARRVGEIPMFIQGF